MEAEFVECFEAAIQALLLRNFVSVLIVIDTIAKLLNNFVVLFFSKNDKYSKGEKHMELKYFYIKEEVRKQRVFIEHVIIGLMIFDALTKGLQSKRHGA